MTDQPAAPESLPLNDLESKLAKSGQPDANPVDVILAFLNNEVYILSTDSLDKPDAAVEPLVLANSEGQPVLAVFSHPSRVESHFLEAAPNVLGTHGSAILDSIGDELGLVINPGSEHGFEMGPEGIANVRRDFTRADEAEEAAGEATAPAAEATAPAADADAESRTDGPRD
ncbi:SseB family protein [Arthrobacter sp. KN11-1C]|uniref:SseB family protein n=1 Tax=Arthrobacter sp. KN11-1C TaxID=3445774 RepID=UPI003FA0CD1C